MFIYIGISNNILGIKTFLLITEQFREDFTWRHQCSIIHWPHTDDGMLNASETSTRNRVKYRFLFIKLVFLIYDNKLNSCDIFFEADNWKWGHCTDLTKYNLFVAVNRELLMERVALMPMINKKKIILRKADRKKILSQNLDTLNSIRLTPHSLLREPKKFTLKDNIIINQIPWIPMACYSSKKLNFLKNAKIYRQKRYSNC